MATSFDIREYLTRDEAQVARLWREVFPDAPARNEPGISIRRKLPVQRELFLVATEADQVVGTVMAGFDGHRGWLHMVAVDPAAQNKGLGQALVREAERRLRRYGCPKVNLQVRGSNATVVAFYESLGYRVEERISMGRLLDAAPADPRARDSS